MTVKLRIFITLGRVGKLALAARSYILAVGVVLGTVITAPFWGPFSLYIWAVNKFFTTDHLTEDERAEFKKYLRERGAVT